MQPSANATTTPPGPPTASARTPPLALVARSVAMEWPSLGLDGREVALKCDSPVRMEGQCQERGADVESTSQADTIVRERCDRAPTGLYADNR